jgi:hypothetical protein
MNFFIIHMRFDLFLKGVKIICCGDIGKQINKQFSNCLFDILLFMYIYIYIYIYMYIYGFTFIYMYIYLLVYVYEYTYICNTDGEKRSREGESDIYIPPNKWLEALNVIAVRHKFSIIVGDFICIYMYIYSMYTCICV